MLGRRFFTLVEMLVVMAVIAVLSALLLPALGNARASANKALCKSNLKQLGVGAMAYVNDYNLLPLSYTTNIAPYQTWVTDVGDQIYSTLDRSRKGIKASLFVCPSDKHILQAPPTGCCGPNGPDVFRVSYGFNAAGRYHSKYRSLSSCAQPSKTLLVCDIGGVVDIPFGSVHFELWNWSVGSYLFSSVHKKVINLALVDGSVGELAGVPGAAVNPAAGGYEWN